MFAIITNLLVTAAFLPSLFATSLRRLDVESYQAVMAISNPFCIIENGYDYFGNDIGNGKGSFGECCTKCANFPNCKVWSWSDFNGGTCWFKNARDKLVISPNVKSAVVFSGTRQQCLVSNNIDYPGNDLQRVDGSVTDCCSKCQAYPGCRAYSWSDLNGGSCWLKSGITQIIIKPGVKSAQAYPDITDSCFTQLKDKDFVGNDLANYPGASTDCCDACKAYKGCTAWSWSNFNGGTCWLKSFKGQVIDKPGVISAQINADNSQCTIQSDTDFEDNDLKPVPGDKASDCCGKCQAEAGCKAFAWSNLNGGTCWLKSQKGKVITKQGVFAGTI